LPTGAMMGIFYLHHHAHTGSGAQTASYSISTGGSYPGDKTTGAWI